MSFEIQRGTFSRRLPQFVAAGSAALGALALGTVAGWTSTSLPDMKLEPEFIHVSNESFSWVGSIAPIGACVSGPLSGFLLGVIGRKGTMLLISPLFVLGWLLIGFATSIDMVYAGRFLTGVGGGTFSLVVPCYVSECSESCIRGTLGSALQLMINFGVLIAFTVGYFVNWSTLAFVSSSIPVIVCGLMLLMPESPRYLLMKKNKVAASKALQWLRGATSHEEVMEELNLVQAAIEDDNGVTFRDYLSPCILKPVTISLALMLYQQWNGNNAVIFYTVQIFQAAGSSLNPNIATIIVGAIQVIASIVAAALMDKAGRRILLLVSGVSMTIALAVMGGFFQMKEDLMDIDDLGWLPLLCLVVFIVGFSLGFGPIAWLLAGEILPSKVRGIASALATSFNWFNAFVVTKAFDNIQLSIGIQWCFWIFAIITVFANAYVYVCVPETRGKTLEEIQMLFVPRKTYS
ncbi:facilitated trehalose transporter Tret1-2 homolog [Folsomia candida]|uniref:Facilitated trehalose transporter Tret1-2 n=1 Tax=Folsomia candida TaxID=158441 RepID=A0A226F130_FOLCA|nr:facilitated trehalose transporter Tret1-2 homolog [Folsomia candida]OXA63080.1 Facilitated trehalose transporter Tret1-2 [Folsomia candida]